MRIILKILCSLAPIIGCFALSIDVALFNIARHEFHKFGWSTQFGNALLLTGVGTIALSFVAKSQLKRKPA